MSNSVASSVPLTIVGGFLGAGKTSLMNHLINHASRKRIAVLVNDFGEISIDAGRIVSVEGETTSLANGCVCCTIRDDLVTEVRRLFDKQRPPEHIVIEISGVSNPAAVAEVLFDPALQGLVEVRNIIAVLDAELATDEQAEYRDLAIDQTAIADLVVINKTDLVEAKQLRPLRQRVESIAARARIWETSFGVVPLEPIFDEQAHRAHCGPRQVDPAQTHNDRQPHDRPRHDLQFATWIYRSPWAWSFGALKRAVENLPPDVFRAKGTVRLDVGTDNYGILQVTGKRGWLKLCEAESADVEPVATELVFIGKPRTLTNESIRSHFDRALVETNVEGGEACPVSDLRAFDVVCV